MSMATAPARNRFMSDSLDTLHTKDGYLYHPHEQHIKVRTRTGPRYLLMASHGAIQSQNHKACALVALRLQ